MTTSRRPSGSIPPPIPAAARAKQSAANLIANQLESPSALDKALAALARTTDAMRAQELARTSELTAVDDPVAAAILAYELGELSERLSDEERALTAYRRAHELDRSLVPAWWGLRRLLYRRAAWLELASQLDAKLARIDDDDERVAAYFERAIVASHAGSEVEALASVDALLQIAPKHQGALLELERIAVSGDPALLDAWQRLAEAVDHPGRKLGYWLAVARLAGASEPARAGRALDAAVAVATTAGMGPSVVARIARERVRIAEEAYAGAAAGTARTPDALLRAIELLVEALRSGAVQDDPLRVIASRREQVALLRRHAQLVRDATPLRAWEDLSRALALSPQEPVLLVDLLELAAELGRHDDLRSFADKWQGLDDDDTGRARMLAAWCAEALTVPARRLPLRTLLRAVDSFAPGWLLLVAGAECDALAGWGPARTRTDLAAAYRSLARAAAAGTWLGPGTPATADPRASVALHVQAAHLLAAYIATPAACDEAGELLREALALVPDDPAALETQLELDDLAGRPDAAIDRLRAHGERASLERAIRIAWAHELPDRVVELERELVALAPEDPRLAWRLDATLAELGRHDERIAVLAQLAERDQDPARAATAVLFAARLHERVGDGEGAAPLYRRLAATHPQDSLVREGYLAALRATAGWAELARERRVEAQQAGDVAAARRAFREAAWLLEVKLDDLAATADVYAQWVARLPADRTALEGLARVRGALRDWPAEATTRATLAELDGGPETRWLYARSLERAGRDAEAQQQYRAVAADDDSSVSSVLGVMGLTDLASRSGSADARTEAIGMLAGRMKDHGLAAALHAHAGWAYALTVGDAEAAATAFAKAVDLDPSSPGSLLGTALVSGPRGDRDAAARARIELADMVAVPEVVAAVALRLAASTEVSGDLSAARTWVKTAREAMPASSYALVVAAELGVRADRKAGDPFAAVEQLVTRAELLAARGALADDPRARAAWELERAETLESAGQLTEAIDIVSRVLEANPDNIRAVMLIRRIAQRRKDAVVVAQTSCALARVAIDLDSRIAFLREAAATFDRPGPAHDPDRALAVQKGLLGALTTQLQVLDPSQDAQATQIMTSLVERAKILERVGRLVHARADLEAVIEHAPDHAEAVRALAALERKNRKAPEDEETTNVHARDLHTARTNKWDLEQTARGEPEELDNETDTRPALRVPAHELQAPDLELTDPMAQREAGYVALDPRALQVVDDETAADDSAVVMMRVDALEPVSSKDDQRQLLAYLERDIVAAGEPARGVAVRVEAGRLAEALGNLDKAITHYEAAIVADPQAGVAIRGLRRIARDQGDFAEVARLVEAELAIAGPREREALRHYQADLLLALGEQDLARVAVGAILDGTPGDVAALLAQLELAFHDDRGEVLASVLDQLAQAIEEPGLRATLHAARAALADRDGDRAAAESHREHAIACEPTSIAMRLSAIELAVSRAQAGAAATAYLDLACLVEGEDPTAAAALAIRSLGWAEGTEAEREVLGTATQLAVRAAGKDPLVARLAAEGALRAGDHAVASLAFSRWARCKTSPEERAYAAARGAELEPARLGRLWSQALELDPDCDHAAARLREALVAAGELRQAIDLDLQSAGRGGREWFAARAASDALALGDVDRAIELAEEARDAHPTGVGAAELLADAYARAERWHDRAELLAEAAATPGLIASELARLRAAHAWHAAATVIPTIKDPGRAETTPAPRDLDEEQERATIAALDAWAAVLDVDPHAPEAHAAAAQLAGRLTDPDILLDVLARTETAEISPWAASTLALHRARLVARSDARLAQDIAAQRARPIYDPRRTLVVMLAAAERRELGDAASALEERAAHLESVTTGGAATLEAATLRLRAATLALHTGDAARAEALLVRVAGPLPLLVDDLLAAARGRYPAPAGAPVAPRSGESFVRALHDADLAAARGDGALALELYQRALALRSTDPLAAWPVIRLAFEHRHEASLRALVREQIRVATVTNDRAALADAHVLAAKIEAELASDVPAAHAALDQALVADPTRFELLRRRGGDALALRERELELVKSRATPRDLAALATDAAVLARQAGRADAALVAHWRLALEAQPDDLLALSQLHGLVRRSGATEALATLEERIANTLADPRSTAAFLVRAGDTLAALERPADALQRYVRAVDKLTAYAPALDAWSRIALAHELWLDYARALMRNAELGGPPKMIAALYHLAGIVLSERAQSASAAIGAFRRALEAEPADLDSFLRLRALFEAGGRRDELAALLGKRLEVETDKPSRIELHRALGEHWNEAGKRDLALAQLRALIKLDPADVRAHAAIVDVLSASASWQDASEAVLARIPLEQDPALLRSLHARLAKIYERHDPAGALKALERAGTQQTEDPTELTKIVDLAIAAQDWQTALGACDQLVTTERDPETLASHLHRAAQIFSRGIGDAARAERMLDLEFESAPTSVDMLERLVEFHRGGGDPSRLQARMASIADVMRKRIAEHPTDGAAYRILSRATADAAPRVARCAAEIAQILGVAGEPEQQLVAGRPVPDLGELVGTAADRRLCAGVVSHDLVRVFSVLGTALARHVAADLEAYGVGRKDRLPPGDPLVAIVRGIAGELGIKDLDVFVAPRFPYVMAAEPTQPLSLILGGSLARGEVASARYAAGTALKLAQMSLAVPARLGSGELGTLVLAMLRLFQPDAVVAGVDPADAATQLQRLRKLVPPAALDEARSHALAVRDVQLKDLAQGLKIVGLRAGVAAAGTLLPGFAILAAVTGKSIPDLVGEPVGRAVTAYAIGSDGFATG